MFQSLVQYQCKIKYLSNTYTERCFFFSIRRECPYHYLVAAKCQEDHSTLRYSQHTLLHLFRRLVSAEKIEKLTLRASSSFEGYRETSRENAKGTYALSSCTTRFR